MADNVAHGGQVNAGIEGITDEGTPQIMRAEIADTSLRAALLNGVIDRLRRHPTISKDSAVLAYAMKQSAIMSAAQTQPGMEKGLWAIANKDFSRMIAFTVLNQQAACPAIVICKRQRGYLSATHPGRIEQGDQGRITNISRFLTIGSIDATDFQQGAYLSIGQVTPGRDAHCFDAADVDRTLVFLSGYEAHIPGGAQHAAQGG